MQRIDTVLHAVPTMDDGGGKCQGTNQRLTAVLVVVCLAANRGWRVSSASKDRCSACDRRDATTAATMDTSLTTSRTPSILQKHTSTFSYVHARHLERVVPHSTPTV